MYHTSDASDGQKTAVLPKTVPGAMQTSDLQANSCFPLCVLGGYSNLLTVAAENFWKNNLEPQNQQWLDSNIPFTYNMYQICYKLAVKATILAQTSSIILHN